MTDHPEYLALRRAIVAEPEDAARCLVLADWLEEHGLTEEAAAARNGRLLVDSMEKAAAETLAHCTFLPASYDKRFVRNVCQAISQNSLDLLTPKQLRLLWTLAVKYRRQIKRPALVAYARQVTGKTEGKPKRPKFPEEPAPAFQEWVDQQKAKGK